MSMLVFFPWLRLQKTITAGDFILLPYKRFSEPAGYGTPLQYTLDALTEPYLYQAGQPIEEAALAQFGQGDVTRDLSDEERSAAYVLSEILGIFGLSCRTYYEGGALGYCNRDNFRIVIQAFADPQSGVAITTRRRHGSTTQWWSNDRYHVQKPEHVQLYSNVRVDEPLLQALLLPQESSSWDRFFESIVNFNLANTDNGDMAVQTEVVLLNGAIERLLDCHHGKEDELAERFADTLVPTRTRAPSACARLSGPDLANRFKKSTSIRNMWIRDFFHLRNDLAHGKVTPRYRPVWFLGDHLLLASFVFPLLLKKVLAGENIYTLNEKDQFQIDCFEPLACEEHLFPATHQTDPNACAWNQVLERETREHLVKRIAAKMGLQDGS